MIAVQLQKSVNVLDIIENDILNNIGNQSVSDEKKRRIPAAAIFLVMIFIVVCVLTVYCIVSDINRGKPRRI